MFKLYKIKYLYDKEKIMEPSNDNGIELFIVFCICTFFIGLVYLLLHISGTEIGNIKF